MLGAADYTLCMTTETLAKLHKGRPFVPFVINMADGRAFRVDHPEFLAYREGSRMAILTLPNNDFEHIDLLMVTSLTEAPRRRKSA